MAAKPGPIAHTDDWYEARRKTVTASVSAPLMLPDLPWSVPPKELADRIRSEDRVSPNEKMAAGAHFEEANYLWLQVVSGLCVRGLGELWLDQERPWMAASPDAWMSPYSGWEPLPEFEPPLWIRDEWGIEETGYDACEYLRGVSGDGLLVELKQTQSRNRHRWTKDGPPDHYYSQVQHQMHVLGLTRALIVCKVDSFEMRGHLLVKDRAYCVELEERCKDLWERYLR